MFHSSGIPENCSLIAKGKLTLLIRNDYKDRLFRQGILNPQRLISTAPREEKQFEGRGLLPSIPIQENNGKRMVAKLCLRGGLLQLFNRDIFWGGNRPLKEMIANTQILSRGIRTTEILAAAKERVVGPLYRNFVFSLELTDCVDLINFFEGLKKQSPEKRFEQKKYLFQAIARSLATMHSKGIYHSDLHLKNILISQKDSSSRSDIYIIDFDKAILKGTLSPEEKINNLRRFNRSMEKYKLQGGLISRTDQSRLLKHYFNYNKELYVLYDKYRNRYYRFMKLRRFIWRVLAVVQTPSRKPNQGE